MIYKTRYLFFGIVSALSIIIYSCDIDIFSEKKQITGNYYLWRDDSEKESIWYFDSNELGEKIISPVKIGNDPEINIISAVGCNNDFIIVKCLDPRVINKTDTSYYIIPLKNKLSEYPIQNYYGPLAEGKYKSLRESLKIPSNLDFSIFP